MNKQFMVYTYKKYYLAMKGNKLLMLETIRIDFRIMMMNPDQNQNSLYVSIYKKLLKKKKKPPENANQPIMIESRSVVAGHVGSGG